MKKALVFTDLHVPLHDKKFVDCLLMSIRIVKPRYLISLGDFGEWESVSHWRYKHRKRPPLEYQLSLVDEDIVDNNVLLDEFDIATKRFPCEKYFIVGNHEVWVDNFIEEHPYLEMEYSLRQALGLKRRGWKLIDDKTPLVLEGREPHYYHGHAYGGKYHAANHLAKLGSVDVIYGHYHGLQIHTNSGWDRPSRAICLGCGKKLDKESNKWTKTRALNWTHNFAIVNYLEEGYTVDIVQVVNGHMVLYGKEYDCYAENN